MDTLGTALLSIKMSGEKKSQYRSKTIGMTLKRQAPDKLGKERFHGRDDEGGVNFPSTEVLFGSNETNLASVDTQVSCSINIRRARMPKNVPLKLKTVLKQARPKEAKRRGMIEWMDK